MKTVSKIIVIGLLMSLLGNSTAFAEWSSWLKPKELCSGIATRLSKAGSYACSKEGAIDIGAAYCLGMGLTAVHEFGHALTAKVFYHDRIHVVLGTMPSLIEKKTYLKLGGLELGGFNPATGYSTFRGGAVHSNHLKNALILIAGPVAGALSSIAAFLLLRKSPKFYVCKTVALYGIFDHILGHAGLMGIAYDGQDLNRFVSEMQQYRYDKKRA